MSEFVKSPAAMPRSVLADTIRRAIDRVDVAAAIVGAAAGYHVGQGFLSGLIRSPEHYTALTTGLGIGAPSVMAAMHAVLGAALTWSAIRAMGNYMRVMMADGERISAERVNDPGYVYRLPPWPGLINQSTGTRQLVLGEIHDMTDGYVPDPTWAIFPELAWWTSIVCFGSTGTGKTASFCNPVTEQMFEIRSDDPEQYVGGLILDVKGDFTAMVREVARKFGRERDILAVRPGGEHRWNPIHAPTDTPQVIAGRLIAVQENLTGGVGKEGGWVVDGTFMLAQHVIGFLRFAQDGYVTLRDVNEFVQASLAQLDEGNATLDRMAPLIEHFNKLSNITDLDRRKFDQHRAWLENTWAHFNQENKSTIGSAFLQITGPFSDPEVADTFCPPESDLSFPGFPACIDNGWIVALDAPEDEFGTLNNILGIFLKLEFQRAALGRISRSKRDPRTNTTRPLLFLCDEYQNFVSITSQRCRDGDDKFVALSRQAKTLNIVATQAPVSLMSKIDETKTRTIMASYRTKVFLALEDPKDAEWAADLCGKDWLDVKNTSFNESVSDAGWSPLDGQMSGSRSTVAENVSYNVQLRHIVDPVKFKRLRRFEAIVSMFDGDRNLPPFKVYLKTTFCPPELEATGYTPRTLPYKLLAEYLKERGK